MSGPGFVYFLATENLDRVRIGWSAAPLQRQATLHYWSPYRLEFLAMVPGTRADEGMLHWLFRAHRVHGEWFFGAPELLTCASFAAALGRLPVRPLPGVVVAKRDCGARRKRGPWSEAERAEHKRIAQVKQRQKLALAQKEAA